MNNSSSPRNINLSNAKGSQNKPSTNVPKQSANSNKNGQSPYGQAAGAQQKAVQEQVRRTSQSPQSSARPSTQAGGQRQGQPQSAARQSAKGSAQRSNMQQNSTRQTSAQGTRSRSQNNSQINQNNQGEPYKVAHKAQNATVAKQPNKAKRSKRKKSSGLNRFLTVMCATFAVVLIGYIGVRIYAGTIISTGEGGTTSKQYRTPPQYSSDELNVLVLGIDYTSEDGQGRSPNGMTDMILYVRFNFVDNTIRMLQIPRDVFVGADEPTGGTGKINSLYANGNDKDDRVNNIAKVLYEQYKLPVDNYVSIDLDSLREVIDLFGGIDVYVTEDMEYAGSYIPAGWQHLDGASSEFFLRNRKQYATSDIRRLENQRYFYSAIFRLVRTSPWQEIVKLVPVVQNYVNTDIDAVDCAALGIKMLKIPSSQIMICRLPVGGSAETFNGQSVLVASVQETANLLNEYFRSPTSQVLASELDIAYLPIAGGLYEANVQWMDAIDADGGGTVGEAATDTQTGDDLIAEEQAAESEALAQAQAESDAAA